jgi:hypothetical protein
MCRILTEEKRGVRKESRWIFCSKWYRLVQVGHIFKNKK